MLDTSGIGLHKRGYRANATEAPIKETLAAAMVKLSRVYRDSILFDPFCGSGTILVEGAMYAMHFWRRDCGDGLRRSGGIRSLHRCGEKRGKGPRTLFKGRLLLQALDMISTRTPWRSRGKTPQRRAWRCRQAPF